jgi:hypothetical protein
LAQAALLIIPYLARNRFGSSDNGVSHTYDQRSLLANY